jgi:hypothetical protein
MKRIIVATTLILLTACTGAPADSRVETVAPTRGHPGDSDCTITTPSTPQPVTSEEAEQIAAKTFGEETLDGAKVAAETRTVCGQELEVWVVTGTLPNGDAATAFVVRSTGQVVHGAISGP